MTNDYVLITEQSKKRIQFLVYNNNKTDKGGNSLKNYFKILYNTRYYVIVFDLNKINSNQNSLWKYRIKI